MKGLIVLVVLMLSGCGFYVVDPGNRGVKVTLGAVDPTVLPEGSGLKAPLITTVYEISVRQQTRALKSEDYSSDLQQVVHDIKVLYRIPEQNVITIFQKYSGDPWDSLIEPRVQQALKAASAKHSAADLVKKREEIRTDALAAVKAKLDNLIVVEDIVIANETLSKELEQAIEAKMVQEQEAEKAVFTRNKAEMDAKTAIIRADGEAKALAIQGEAIRKNPETMEMELIKKWNGVSPLVVGGDAKGPSMILPLGHK